MVLKKKINEAKKSDTAKSHIYIVLQFCFLL